MKKGLIVLTAFVFVSQFIVASNTPVLKSSTSIESSIGEPADVTISSPAKYDLLVINSFDSVFFDLAIANATSTTIEFPVYLRSDDVINALDFSFKYDHTKLDYDTTLILATYVDALSYYNANDSTVRLTSYSFSQPYENDSILFIVKFNILSGQLCSGDLNTVSALLNGDACSHLVVECLNSGLPESESDLNVSFYPNPAIDYLDITFEKLTAIEITDASGKTVFCDSGLKSEGSLKIDISHINSGLYFVRFINGATVKTSKLLVE